MLKYERVGKMRSVADMNQDLGSSFWSMEVASTDSFVPSDFFFKPSPDNLHLSKYDRTTVMDSSFLTVAKLRVGIYAGRGLFTYAKTSSGMVNFFNSLFFPFLVFLRQDSCISYSSAPKYTRGPSTPV